MAEDFNPAFYAEDELITRLQIAELTGVSLTKVATVSKAEFLDFPKPLGKVDREFVYFKSDVMAWLETHDIHDELVKNTESKSTLNNQLATEFLTQKYKNTNEL